jgi:predicted RNase H-like HicB family nuclease
MLRLKSENPRSRSPVDGAVITRSEDFRRHPLATTDLVTIEMEHDEDTQSFVTYVKELHRMSTFGDTEFDALELTREMIRGYIESMEERGMQIPLAQAKLVALKRLVGL